ncbi:hypothetical protein LIER_10330 [Lithospermum erythrorhizon]|uniref:LOB domain-containing protein n=1 Tax=Lithospermum erythrorhizon TaxID=34254 RepID=A0AAV3PIU1_LITER
MSTTTGAGSPCGACKFLRRKCTQDCVFAPYFGSEEGPTRFAAIHKVFGASNVSKLLLHVPVPDRSEAVVTIAYEAQARIRDPVYGCVSHIIALQQQVTFLQAQLMQVKAQMAQSLVNNSSSRKADGHHQFPSYMAAAGIPQQFFQTYPSAAAYMNSISPQSSLDSNDLKNEAIKHIQEIMQRKEESSASFQAYSKKRHSQTELSELQALAFRMMGD